MIPKETRDRLDELVATLSRDEPANSEDAKEIAADITAILAELDRLEKVEAECNKHHVWKTPKTGEG